MQYFIVYKEYRNERPFDPSLLVIFRKRLPEETMCRIIEKMVIKADDDKKDKSSHTGAAIPVVAAPKQLNPRNLQNTKKRVPDH